MSKLTINPWAILKIFLTPWSYNKAVTTPERRVGLENPVDIVKDSERKLDLIPRLATVPFGREMQAHVVDLASLLTNKTTPSLEAGFQTVPDRSDTHVDIRDCNKILENIEREFRHASAFLSPWDLDRRLIESSGRNIPAAALDLASDYGNVNRTPEPLTGGHRKAQAPLMTAMAFLYAQARHENVYILDLDYSNMGGTNLHFYKALCAANHRSNALDADGKPVHHDLYGQAMGLTDRVARILAEIPRERILSSAPSCRVDTLRVGGDEVRYIVTGASPDSIPHLPETIHRSCESLTRDLGLHDYVYSKDEAQENRRGGGSAVSWFRLGEPGTPYHVAAHTVDEEIKAYKDSIGKDRLSDFFISQKKASLQARYDDPATAAAYLNQVEDVLQDYETRYHIPKNTTHKGWLRESLRYYAQSVSESDPLSRPRLGADAKPKAIGDLVNMSGYHYIPAPEDLRRLLADQYRGDLNERGINLSENDQRLAGVLFLKFPYPDYVTGTLMDSDFPMMAGIASAVARRNKNALLDTLALEDPERAPLRDVGLWGIGIKFHNIKGYNATLGHEATNVLLDALSNEILKEALKDVGVTGKDACVAHYGGGSFLGTVLPVIRNADGSFSITDPTRLGMLEKAIERRLGDLNRKDISSFLENKGLSLTNPSWAGKTLGDIPNGDEKEQGWKDGLTCSVCVKNLAPLEKTLRREQNMGGAIAANIQTALTRAVSEKDARLRAAASPAPRVDPSALSR